MVNYWATIATAVTAVAALTISLYTAVQLNTRADLIVSMPRVIDVRSYGEGGSYIVVQPSFYVDEKSDVSTVISDLKLTMSHREAGDARKLIWQDNITYEVEGGSFRHRWNSRTGPIVVKAEAPQSPNARFAQPEGNPIRRSGIWDLTLTIDRLEQSPMTIRFCLDIDQVQVDRLLSTPPEGWRSTVFRNPVNFTTTEQETVVTQCYKEGRSE